MQSVKRFLNWRIGFAVCCLVYVAWVVHLSRNNFDMVHSQYRLIERHLQPQHLARTALQELTDRCRQAARLAGPHPRSEAAETAMAADPCLSWPAAVVAERQQKVEARLTQERNLAIRKLVLFYLSFGFFFLFVPPALLYLLLSFFSWLYRNIMVVR